MEPLKIVETTPGQFSLILNAGTTAVDSTVEELGHEPNGYFWEGIAQLLVQDAPDLAGRFDLDPEGDMFVAHGPDRDALDQLRALLAAAASSPGRMRELVALAAQRGFEFDD